MLWACTYICMGNNTPGFMFKTHIKLNQYPIIFCCLNTTLLPITTSSNQGGLITAKKITKEHGANIADIEEH